MAKSTPAKAEPKLLSGGNPQIAKGEGDGPVQAYIAAMDEHDMHSLLISRLRRHLLSPFSEVTV